MAECLDKNENSENSENFSTQPNSLNSEQNECTVSSTNNQPWAWLCPTRNMTTHSIALTKSSYTFGRSKAHCDHQFRKDQFRDNSLFNLISHVHFTIEREHIPFTPNDCSKPPSFFITDKSMNGTYVDARKLEKGRKEIILSNSVISLCAQTNTVFIFMQNDVTPQSWMNTPVQHASMYKLGDSIGKGTFGEVRQAFDRASLKLVAIKKIQKFYDKNDGEKSIQNETRILQELKHENIIAMESYVESPTHVFLILEYVHGGNLGSKMRRNGPLLDHDAKLMTYQLSRALHYIHQKNIIHRDIKPDNVLLAPYPSGEIAKLCDFGLSKIMEEELKTVCGSPCYMAPEIILSKQTGSYTQAADVWSLGVLLFFCLSGDHPFRSRPGMMCNEQIIRGSYVMIRENWHRINPDARRLTQSLLKVNTTERLTVPNILRHEWLEDKAMKSRFQKILKEAKEYH